MIEVNPETLQKMVQLVNVNKTIDQLENLQQERGYNRDRFIRLKEFYQKRKIYLDALTPLTFEMQHKIDSCMSSNNN